MALVVAGMSVVAASFALMAVADTESMRASRPRLKRTADLVWLTVTIAGWVAVGYLALGTTGGLDAAWEWFAAQALVLRIAMWLLLLPWVGALWISQTSLAEWLQTTLIVGLAVLTIGIAISRAVRSASATE
jgi:hypothetical protein